MNREGRIKEEPYKELSYINKRWR